MTFKCQFCNSKLIEGTTTIKVNINGKSVYIQNIPAHICTDDLCGYESLVGNTVKILEDVVFKAKKEKVDLGNVFDYSYAEDFMICVQNTRDFSHECSGRFCRNHLVGLLDKTCSRRLELFSLAVIDAESAVSNLRPLGSSTSG